MQAPPATTSVPQRPPEISIISSSSNQQQQHELAAAATGSQQPWLAAAARQTSLGVRQRMSQASDQLGLSLRQLYTSASNLTELPPSYHNIPGIVPYYQGRVSGPPPTYDDVVNPYAAPPTYQSLFGQMREARKSSRGLLDLLRRLTVILVSTIGCTLLLATMILLPFTMIIVGAIYIDECRVEHIPAYLLLGGLVWAAKNTLHVYNQCHQEPRSHHHQQQQAPPPVGSSPEDAVSELSTSTSTNSSTSSSSTSSSLHQQDNPSSLQRNQQRAAHRQQAAARRQLRRRLRSSRHCETILNCLLLSWFVVGCIIVLRNYEPDFENPRSPRYCHRTVYLYAFWLITSVMFLASAFIGCICCLMVSSAIASRSQEELA